VISRFILAVAVVLGLAAPASAQIGTINPFAPSTIRVLRPFAAPQGATTQRVTASATDETCVLPATPTSTGLQPKPFSDGLYKWNNDSGQVWNTQVPYAIGKCTTSDGRRRWRFELHDTPYDHGLSDPSTKRRAEIGATASYEKFHNHITYWIAFSVLEHWDNPLLDTELRISQFLHWPSGASPAGALTVANVNGHIVLRVTTCGDSHVNIVRAQVPYTLDVPHDFVIQTTPDGTNGVLNVWMDGKQILAFKGPVGSNIEDGYTFRAGSYNHLGGNRAVEEMGNIAPFPSTADLSARISAPPAW
jgi:hypothetical protein